MGNVSFIDIVSSSGGTGNFVASVVSQNFKNLVAAVNSGGINSQNYGTGTNGFQSQHIAISNVLGSHFADSQIIAGKIATSQVRSQHVAYKSSDTGILAVRQVPGPERPLYLAICSITQSETANTINMSLRIYYSSDAVFGNPSFTTTPQMVGMPIRVGYGTLTGGQGINAAVITAINSVSCDLSCGWHAVRSAQETIHLAFLGARS